MQGKRRDLHILTLDNFVCYSYYLEKNAAGNRGNKKKEKLCVKTECGKRTEKRRWRFAGWLVGGLATVVYFLAAVSRSVAEWLDETYGVGFDQLLYVLASPLKGTGQDVVDECVEACLPAVQEAAVPYLTVFGAVLLLRHFWRFAIGTEKHSFEPLALTELVMLGVGIWAAVGAYRHADSLLDISSYLEARKLASTIYEEEYVDPLTVEITAPEKKRNLICIYLESMETTYASTEDGGAQAVNYIPNLTSLARENVSFSETEGLGGFRSALRTTWTMAALLGTSSGVPFSFPVDGNSMNERETFAAGLTTLGDILAAEGYHNEFLCGSDSEFGGRKDYYTQHGDYEIFDLFTARDKGYIGEDYYVWWGFEDRRLYEIAKDEATRLAGEDEPFNLTLLTVDTHFQEGYRCPDCGSEGGSLAADVVSCADRQVSDFIAWCKEQPFYEDTTIVILGDHPRMDKSLVGETDVFERRVYNCFINAAAETATESCRKFTSLDIFPTTLAALGYTIEGDRLGLGANLFAGVETLAERMGYEALDAELLKNSNYYIRHFA